MRVKVSMKNLDLKGSDLFQGTASFVILDGLRTIS
jgi:hypothetical protein